MLKTKREELTNGINLTRKIHLYTQGLLPFMTTHYISREVEWVLTM